MEIGHNVEQKCKPVTSKGGSKTDITDGQNLRQARVEIYICINLDQLGQGNRNNSKGERQSKPDNTEWLSKDHFLLSVVIGFDHQLFHVQINHQDRLEETKQNK